VLQVTTRPAKKYLSANGSQVTPPAELNISVQYLLPSSTYLTIYSFPPILPIYPLPPILPIYPLPPIIATYLPSSFATHSFISPLPSINPFFLSHLSTHPLLPTHLHNPSFPLIHSSILSYPSTHPLFPIFSPIHPFSPIYSSSLSYSSTLFHPSNYPPGYPFIYLPAAHKS
jgi:hypothetical protein